MKIKGGQTYTMNIVFTLSVTIVFMHKMCICTMCARTGLNYIFSVKYLRSTRID